MGGHFLVPTGSLLLLLSFSISLIEIAFSRGLPKCNLDVSTYFLPKKFVVEKCHIPVSRSYIYSKYNAAFVLSGDGGANINGVVGEDITFSLSACHLETPSQNSSLWVEDDVVQYPIPLHNHTELCESTDFYFLARAISENSIEVATVEKIHNSCEWKISFKPAFTGQYSMEVTNTWIGGSAEPNRTACANGFINEYWDGDQILDPHWLHRGSPNFNCCDKCQLYESCKYWSHNYTAKDEHRKINTCIMFKSVKRLIKLPGIRNSDVSILSGYRKAEMDQIYVGSSLLHQEDKVKEPCRRMGQVSNSPLKFTVVAVVERQKSASLAYENSLQPSSENSNFCVSGEVNNGLWVRLFESHSTSCSKLEEIREMLSRARLVSMQMQSDNVHYISEYFHESARSTLYCKGIIDSSSSALLNSYNRSHVYDRGHISHVHHRSSHKLTLDHVRKMNCSFWDIKNFSHPSFPFDSVKYHPHQSDYGIDFQPWQLHPQCNLQYPSTVLEYRTTPFYTPYFEWASSSGNGCVYKHYSYGAARECLRNNGISRFVVRGDSVANGILSNMKWYLKTDPYRDWPFTLDRSLEIRRDFTMKNKNGISWGCPFSFLMDHSKIYQCIESFKQLAGYELPHNNLVNYANNSVGILNFDIQHLLWHHTIEEVLNNTNMFFKLFKEEKAKGYFKNTTFIFFNGMADHSFREPFCTTQRSQKLSQLMGDQAKSAGWMVLDAFNVTLLRPDSSVDGMHYSDAINYMFIQMILNMVCNHDFSK